MFKYLLILGIFGGMLVSSWQKMPHNVDIFFLDVGQGDATLIQARDGTTVLIDGGPDLSVLEEVGRAMPWFDHTIEYLVLTHPDADHIVGLVEIARRYRIEHMVWTRVEHTHPAYIELIEYVEHQNIHEMILDKPQQVRFGSLSFEVLAPLVDPSRVSKLNDTSIVLRLVYGETTVLLTGDITSDVEEAMREVYDMKSDILKVAHHGSRTSTSEKFLHEVQPEIAVIEVGQDNRFGHPTREVLERLNASGVRIFRTDFDGAVKCSLRSTFFFCI